MIKESSVRQQRAISTEGSGRKTGMEMTVWGERRPQKLTSCYR